MKLMYLSQDAIDDIKLNFEDYKKHFTDLSNDWFMKIFKRKGWIHESKIECADLKMCCEADFNISDRKNVEIVYEALKELTPVQAADERLWAGVLFCQLWDYVKYRRGKELKSEDEKDILNSFFFMRGTKRSCFMNCLSRLWWTGYLLYDGKSQNPYAAVDMICESAYASNIILLSSNNFISNKELALGLLDCMIERKSNGEKIDRYHYVEANKYLNCIGGISLLDTMTREETKVIVNKRLDKVYLT